MIQSGLDRLLADGARRLAGRPYALLAHGASVTSGLVPAHLALARSAAGPPALLSSRRSVTTAPRSTALTMS